MFHNINGFVIKVWVILLGGCLTGGQSDCPSRHKLD